MYFDALRDAWNKVLFGVVGLADQPNLTFNWIVFIIF
jgi:hypothetical protein